MVEKVDTCSYKFSCFIIITNLIGTLYYVYTVIVIILVLIVKIPIYSITKALPKFINHVSELAALALVS